MIRKLPNARLLPATIGVLGMLLTVKAVTLTESALAGEVGEPAPGPDAIPASSTLPTPKTPQKVLPPSAATRFQAVQKPAAAGALVASLEQEQIELERQRSELDAREGAIKAASAALDHRLGDLKALDQKMSDAKAEHKTQSDVAWTGLVKVYEAMRPEDAATIFNGLEIHTLLQLLDRMNERKAALVLAAMQPERARVATQMLAQRRLSDLGGPSVASGPS